MSRNYRFHNPDAPYFVSFSVVKWLNIFEDDQYKNILLKSLRFCQQNKGMEIYAWCIMTNHVHLVFRSMNEQPPELLLGDFKSFTSNQIIKELLKYDHLAKNRMYLNVFKTAAEKLTNVKHHQFWQHHNHPIELWSNHVISQKIRYIHNNPVAAGYVSYPDEYAFSSARDYYGGKGVLEDVVVVSLV